MNSMLRSILLWAAGITVCAFAVLVGYVAYTNSRPSALEQDLYNLWAIGAACRKHAALNSGEFPVSWAAIEGSELEPHQFLCKGNRRNAKAMSGVQEWTDYVYISGLTTNSPPRNALAYSPPDNHFQTSGGKVRAVVLYVEGSAEVLSEDAWNQLEDSQQLNPRHLSLELQSPDS